MENIHQYINARKRGREVEEPSSTSKGDELDQNSLTSEQLKSKGTGMQEDLNSDDSLMMSTVSVHAMTGTRNLTCMKVIGLVNGNKAMRILIDTGSTLNLLDLNTAKRLGCSMKAIPPITLIVGDGRKVYSSYVCESFTWKMQGASFTTDMYLLQLGLEGGGIVLGIQWLVTLGDIRWNFSQLRMEFTVQGRKVSLRGSQPMANSVLPNAESNGQNAYRPGGQCNNNIPSIIPQVGSRRPALDSVAHTGNANEADWQEETYQKIKSRKEMYLPRLYALFQKIASKLQQHDSLPHHSQNENIETLKMFKIALERIVLFLRLNKHDIQLSHKEKLPSIERYISLFLNSNRLRKLAASLMQGQLPQPPMQLQQPQSLDGQTNPSMQPIQGSMAAMQQNSLSNLQHKSLSGVSTITNSQQHMINTVQPGSNVDIGQGKSLNSLQQVATGSLRQNPVSGPQQVNINSLSSQSGTNPVQANLGQPNSNILQQSLPKQNEQQMLQNQQLRRQYHQQMLRQLLHRQQLMQQQQAKQQQTLSNLKFSLQQQLMLQLSQRQQLMQQQQAKQH